MNRAQHIIPSGIVFFVGVWIAWVSFTQQPSEAFLFPRLISAAFVALAGWTFVKALLGWSKVGSGVTRSMALNLAPGLIVSLIPVTAVPVSMGTAQNGVAIRGKNIHIASASGAAYMIRRLLVRRLRRTGSAWSAAVRSQAVMMRMTPIRR